MEKIINFAWLPIGTSACSDPLIQTHNMKLDIYLFIKNICCALKNNNICFETNNDDYIIKIYNDEFEIMFDALQMINNSLYTTNIVCNSDDDEKLIIFINKINKSFARCNYRIIAKEQ